MVRERRRRRGIVTLDSPESTKVADYWQGLIADDLVSKVPAVDRRVEQRLQHGRDWTWISAVWGANSISSGAPDTSRRLGRRADAAVERGRERRGQLGRIDPPPCSRASKHPYEAAQFALWLNTDAEALTALNKEAQPLPRDEGRR